jgi:hypothetical protein
MTRPSDRMKRPIPFRMPFEIRAFQPLEDDEKIVWYFAE